MRHDVPDIIFFFFFFSTMTVVFCKGLQEEVPKVARGEPRVGAY